MSYAEHGNIDGIFSIEESRSFVSLRHMSGPARRLFPRHECMSAYNHILGYQWKIQRMDVSVQITFLVRFSIPDVYMRVVLSHFYFLLVDTEVHSLHDISRSS